MKILRSLVLAALPMSLSAADPWLVFEGKDGPGKGKHIVLAGGDEEYRSEESLPMLGRLLAEKHGFRCTVLFAIDPKTGEINPNEPANIPNFGAIGSADFLIMKLRFRELPDAEMKHFVDYVEAGKPLLAFRTSTHAFAYKRDPGSPYAEWSWNSKEWPGGFGRQILGETWVNHHGKHKFEAARGVIEQANAGHPLLRGVEDLFDPADVYGVTTLPDDATVLFRGQVLDGMTPDAQPVAGAKNTPMMPAGWVRERPMDGGGTQKVIATTFGSAEGFVHPGLRRFTVNAAYWACGLEVPEKADVKPVGAYRPSHFGFDGFQRGKKPQDMVE